MHYSSVKNTECFKVLFLSNDVFEWIAVYLTYRARDNLPDHLPIYTVRNPVGKLSALFRINKVANRQH